MQVGESRSEMSIKRCNSCNRGSQPVTTDEEGVMKVEQRERERGSECRNRKKSDNLVFGSSLFVGEESFKPAWAGQEQEQGQGLTRHHCHHRSFITTLYFHVLPNGSDYSCICCLLAAGCWLRYDRMLLQCPGLTCNTSASCSLSH